LASAGSDPTRVLFIAGAARSGSTLLTRLLATSPGVFAAGEVFHLWEEGGARDDPCGCGLPFRTCPVWGEVGRRIPQALDRDEATAVAARQQGLAVAKNLTRLWTGRGRRGVLAEIDEGHRRLLGRTYQAVADVAGCQVIVDSSKSPLYGYALAHTPGLELAVVHLVRDPRATAGSRAVGKFDPQRSVEFQAPRSATRMALSWMVTHGSVEALRRSIDVPWTTVRYEDFVSQPAAALADAFPPGWATAPDVGHDVDLAPAHLVAGDPDRFVHGRTRLELREGWRERISARRKLEVTALSLPLLRRYRYPLTV
jgi:hypothetical protein